jgi:hypothetical protein
MCALTHLNAHTHILPLRAHLKNWTDLLTKSH